MQVSCIIDSGSGSDYGINQSRKTIHRVNTWKIPVSALKCIETETQLMLQIIEHVFVFCFKIFTHLLTETFDTVAAKLYAAQLL